LRPEGAAGFFDYVYLRDNRDGRLREHWYHAQGCRNWIVVTRDVSSHEIFQVQLTRPAPP
jgi:sarcosine oxidase subunit delta